MLRRGLCPRLSFAPFPRRIPRARLSPRAKEQAMPALRRPLPAFPSPVKCRRCPPRPPVFRPLRDGRFFARLFPGRAVFVRSPSDAPAFICAAAHTNAADETDAPRHRRILPFAPLFSLFERTSPFFRTAKIILSLPPSFVAAQKTAFAEQSPLSESAASKNTTAEPAAQDGIPFKAPRQKTRPPNPRHNRTFLEGQRQSALRRTFVRRRAL